MNSFKKILQYPIKRTLIATLVLIFVYISLAALEAYINRLLNGHYSAGTYPNNATFFLFFVRMIVGDFALLSRIAVELLTITLVAQVIYRVINSGKNHKE